MNEGMDAVARRVDKILGSASMGSPRHLKRRVFLRIVPAQLQNRFTLASDLGMKLHVETDDLARRIADTLLKHEERLLSELVARITRELKTNPTTSHVGGQSGDTEIEGIVPHRLYPVSFVAERWNVSPDNVRKKSEEELPRSDWKGGEIRYRGIEILRYEGVDIEEHLDGSSSQLRDPRGSQSPEAPQSKGRSSCPNEGSEDERPYNGDLPALSDEESSSD